MDTYILGAGASVHAGYPLASKLGLKLDEWVQSRPDNDEIKSSIDQVKHLYGNFDDFEEVLTRVDSDLHDLLSRDRNSFNEEELERKVILSHAKANVREGICLYFDWLGTANSANAYANFCARHLQNGDVAITFNYGVSLEREANFARKWDIADGYGFC